jgi:hypothetical protein
VRPCSKFAAIRKHKGFEQHDLPLSCNQLTLDLVSGGGFHSRFDSYVMEEAWHWIKEGLVKVEFACVWGIKWGYMSLQSI